MKLLYCLQCDDIVRLYKEDRKCECGISGGRYVDPSKAVVYGDAIPFAIMNNEFGTAIVERTEEWPGAWFRGFIIPTNAENVEWQTQDSVPSPA